MVSDDPAALRALAVQLGEQAAALLEDGLGSVRELIETKSTLTDMVTEMDRASERLIVDGILAARPDDGILGEEGTDRPGTSGVRWIIDPLDGTTNYIYAHPGFAVSIAVARTAADARGDAGSDAGGDGGTEEVIAAAVVDPLHRTTFSAHLRGGATRNGDGIRCADETDLGRALVATGFSYDPGRRQRQAGVVAALMPEIRDIRRMGAAAVDLCAVACGQVDASFEKGLAPWDYAAGALIAAEAGAVVGDLDGGPASSGFTLAANPVLFATLRDRLAAAGAADV